MRYLLKKVEEGGGGGGGTTNYETLSNKPSINGVELTGNKSLEDLGIDLEVSRIFNINKIAEAILFPIKQKFSKDIKFTEVTLMSNCTNINLTVGSNTYDKDTLIDVVIPANTEFTIDDITIAEGELSGDVDIKFIEL